MIENFGRIERFRGTVEAIEGGRVTLSDGTRLDADIVLWGTGYATDLSLLRGPAARVDPQRQRTVRALRLHLPQPRCAGPVLSRAWAWTASAPRRGPTC